MRIAEASSGMGSAMLGESRVVVKVLGIVEGRLKDDDFGLASRGSSS